MSEKLCEYLHKLDKPCVFRGMLSVTRDGDEINNSCCEWTPDKLAEIFAGEKFTFRIGKRTRHENYKTQFENECEYVEAEVSEFIDWLSRAERSSSNKRAKLEKGHAFERFYSNEEFWAYADYKYMIELLDTARLNQNCIDWRSFGFAERNARHSTLWIGSEGAYTPCHFDTYGYNLVAQIYGKKRWTMFPKSDSAFMYPTRVPFEESTVYSRVNIKSPDLTEFPLFKNAKPHVIELEPGDVLYVPKNWWHFVENCATSISINTWVELEINDNYSRLKEIVSKTVLQALMDSNMIEFDKWINSSENYTSQEENMAMVKKCLDVLRSQSTRTELPADSDNCERLVEKNANFVKFVDRVGIEDLLTKEKIPRPARDDTRVDYLVELSNAATQPNVIELITSNLLNNLGINHHKDNS